jgi:tetratricopeptide (TPR) repeat protein
MSKTKNKRKPAKARASLKKAAPPVSFSPFDTERMNRKIGKLLQGREFEDIDEANKFIGKVLERENVKDLGDTSMFAGDPIETAQELAFQSMEATSDRKSLELARNALELDPDCIDARMVVIQLTVADPNKRVDAFKKVLEDTRRKMGSEFFEENKGHFWGIVETRPFMRALETQAFLLSSLGRVGEAIAAMEEMLALNPNDNQGVRDPLLGLYLGESDVLKAHMLLNRYSEDDLAIFSWGRAIERFLSGDMAAARNALDKAFDSNPHILAVMAGVEDMPDDYGGGYSPGDVSEAWYCLSVLGPVFEKQPDFMTWLASELPRLLRA